MELSSWTLAHILSAIIQLALIAVSVCAAPFMFVRVRDRLVASQNSADKPNDGHYHRGCRSLSAIAHKEHPCRRRKSFQVTERWATLCGKHTLLSRYLRLLEQSFVNFEDLPHGQKRIRRQRYG